MPELAGICERNGSVTLFGVSAMATMQQNRGSINRLLVVEDEPLVAFDNEYALEQAGYAIVATVDRGEAAIAIIESGEAIDAIVLDVTLAGAISGRDVARLAAQHAIPVLFVTGQAVDDVRDLAFGMLEKPYRPQGLVAALRAVDALARGQEPGATPSGVTLFRSASATG